MKRALLAPLLLAAACAGTPAAPAPTESAPVRDRLTLVDAQAEYDALPWRNTFHDWTPSDEDLALASRVGTPEGDAALDALPLEDRVRVLRAGLRLEPGPASYACVRELGWRWLDVSEHAVAVDHLLAELRDPSAALPPGAHWRAIEYFGAADVPRILDGFRDLDRSSPRAAKIGTAHKVAHAEHFPHLAEFLTDPAHPPHDEAWYLMVLVTSKTDQHRELVARVCHRVVDETGIGLHGALADELRHVIDEPSAWANDAFRWLVDSRPAARDIDLLLRGDDDHGRAEFLWSLRHLSDPRIDARLSEYHQWAIADPERLQEAELAALALLVQRGSASALKLLRDDARNDADAFAFLVHAAPDAAFDLLVDVIREADSYEPAGSSGKRPIETLLTIVERARFRGPSARFDITWPTDRWSDVHDALIASPARWHDLLRAANAFPELRTRELLEIAFDDFDVPEGSPEADDADAWDLGQVSLVLFEITFPDASRRRLLRCAEDKRPEVSSAARAVLVELGDPRPLFWPDEWWDGRPRWLTDPDEEAAAVRVLRNSLTDDPDDRRFWPVVQWLAERDGFPSTVSFDQVPRKLDTAELRRTVREAILANRPFDAFARLLEALPDEVLVNEGDVDDPRVTAHLRRLRDARHLGQYAPAIAELAIAGDPAAGAEQWQALRRGLYRWCDEMDARQATLGNDLGLVEYWARFTEASCCQQPTGLAKLDDAFDLPRLDDNGFGWTTLDVWRRWSAPRTGRFAWSRLADSFVHMPR